MFGFAAAAATTAPSPAVTHHTYEDTASAVAGEQSSPAQSLHATNTSRPRAPSEADEAEDVDGHQWTEENLSGLKNRELQDILARLGLKKSGKKKELIDRILGREVVEKNKPKWKNSKARALLVKLLMDKDSSVHSMTWQQIHSSHEWFSEFDAKSFKKYVKDLRKANLKKMAIIDEDNRIIHAELKKFPRPDKTARGEPFWDTHPSKLLLRADVKAGKHLEMKPGKLHQTRPEYQAFSLKTFRQHIYQEKRHQKELPLRVHRRNKKAKYKYEKEVKENVTSWEAALNDGNNAVMETVLSDEESN